MGCSMRLLSNRCSSQCSLKLNLRLFKGVIFHLLNLAQAAGRMKEENVDAVAENIGVCAEPELEVRQLTADNPFLVVASDGVFEFLQNQKIVDMVSIDKRLSERSISCEAFRALSFGYCLRTLLKHLFLDTQYQIRMWSLQGWTRNPAMTFAI